MYIFGLKNCSETWELGVLYFYFSSKSFSSNYCLSAYYTRFFTSFCIWIIKFLSSSSLLGLTTQRLSLESLWLDEFWICSEISLAIKKIYSIRILLSKFLSKEEPDYFLKGFSIYICYSIFCVCFLASSDQLESDDIDSGASWLSVGLIFIKLSFFKQECVAKLDGLPTLLNPGEKQFSSVSLMSPSKYNFSKEPSIDWDERFLELFKTALKSPNPCNFCKDPWDYSLRSTSG